jgi:hypothetical protein
VDISYSTTRIAHCCTLIPVLPADLGAQDRLAAVVFLEATILATLIEAGAACASARHASIHARLGPDRRHAVMIFVNTVVYAHLRLLHTALPIASACALCSVSKACLSAEYGHTLIILIDTIVLASTIIVNRASLHAVGSIAPAILAARHWYAVVVFIDTVVCAANVRDITF